MTPIAKLLEKAAAALPPQKPSRSSWAPFTSVVLKLQDNGYNAAQAVDWLIGEGAIAKGDRTKASKGIRELLRRRQPSKVVK